MLSTLRIIAPTKHEVIIDMRLLIGLLVGVWLLASSVMYLVMARP